MRTQLARLVDNIAGQQFDRTGVRQTATHDEYQCDDNRCRVAKAGKCQLFRYYASKQCNQQSAERNDVVAPAAPDKQYEHRKQQCKQDDLISHDCSLTDQLMGSELELDPGPTQVRWWSPGCTAHSAIQCNLSQCDIGLEFSHPAEDSDALQT